MSPMETSEPAVASPLPAPERLSRPSHHRFDSRWFGRLTLRIASILLIQAVAIGISFRLVAPTYPIGPLDLQVRLQPSWRGATEIMLPPLGRVSARTHAAPVTVSLMPAGMRVRSINLLVEQVKNSRATLQQMKQDARQAARSLMLRLMATAFVSAALVAGLIGRRSLRRSVAMGLTGGGLILAGCLLLSQTYHAEAFRRPRYTGVLSKATAAIQLAQRGFANLDKVETQLRNSATNLARFYSRMETLAPPASSDGLVRVLHVSDLHNNRLGLEFARTLAREYKVGLIACTGDLTDYGSPLENELLDGWRRMTVPTLFVSGNHDSRSTVAALKRIPNAIVLEDGKSVERLGLRFIGWEDPVSARPGAGDADYAAGDLEALDSRIRTTLQGMNPRPDVLLLHNYRVAEPLAGTVPVLLYGHDHRARLAERDGSTLVDAGTTGAAGVRYFTVAVPPPFSAALLSFRPGTPPRLIAVDLIEVRQPEGSFSIQRYPVE
jgi:predicted phosphodiesterase